MSNALFAFAAVVNAFAAAAVGPESWSGLSLAVIVGVWIAIRIARTMKESGDSE